MLVKSETNSVPLILKPQIKQPWVVIFQLSLVSKIGEGWWKASSSLLLSGSVNRHSLFMEQFLISNDKNVHSLRPGNSPSKKVSSGNKLSWDACETLSTKTRASHPVVLLPQPGLRGSLCAPAPPREQPTLFKHTEGIQMCSWPPNGLTSCRPWLL